MDALQHAAALFHQALAQQQAGRLAEAEALYRQALALAPDRPSVLINLAVVMIQRQAFAEALRLSERVLHLQPGHADALQNAALCRRQLQGGGALELLRQAVAARPQDVEALSNLAVALRESGDELAAIETLDRALALDPTLAGARTNRAAARAACGRTAEALEDYLAVLQLDPDSDEAQRGFFAVCSAPGFEPPLDEAFRAQLLAALRTPWGRPQNLVGCVLRLLRADPTFAPALAPGAGVEPPLSSGSRDLLLALLPRAALSDVDFERWWVRRRDQALELLADSPHEESRADLDLLCALAAQAWHGEYLATPSAAARDAAERIAQRLATSLGTGEAAQTSSRNELAVQVAACASVGLLSASPFAPVLLRHAWPEPLQPVVDAHLRHAYEEAGLRAQMSRLTPIVDAVSQRVQAQYEEHPYPRWSALPRVHEPSGLAAHLAARLGALPKDAVLPSGRLRVLVAGCGTGQQPIEIAQSIAGADVLAVDLSLASLAYAQRRAQAMGLTNLRFAQADLLLLGGRALQFDLIECSGVLHHLADPARGLAVLASLLRPGGWMCLALYSERGRRAVVAARALIADHGWSPDLEGMRACRAHLLALPADHPARGVTAYNDFYAASPCRDLLFHVQEHRFSPLTLRSLLDPSRLEFLGFELPASLRSAFAAEHPAPHSSLDFDAWERFESRHPDAFASMYQFWVRTPG